MFAKKLLETLGTLPEVVNTKAIDTNPEMMAFERVEPNSTIGIIVSISISTGVFGGNTSWLTNFTGLEGLTSKARFLTPLFVRCTSAFEAIA